MTVIVHDEKQRHGRARQRRQVGKLKGSA